MDFAPAERPDDDSASDPIAPQPSQRRKRGVDRFSFHLHTRSQPRANPERVRRAGIPATNLDCDDVVEPTIESLFRSFRSTGRADLAEAVHQRTVLRLRLFAATLLHDVNDVDDVVQDTFIAAFERPECWDEDRPLLPWLCGILRHRALNHGRSERRRRHRENRDGGSYAPPIDAMEAEEIMREVQLGIATLPRLYREVVAPNLLDGVSSADIARGLGRAESTVRVQLSRGLRMLRDALPMGIGAALALAILPGHASAAALVSSTAQDLPARTLPRWFRARPLALLTALGLLPIVAALTLFGGGITEPVVIDTPQEVTTAAPIAAATAEVARTEVLAPVSPSDEDASAVLEVHVGLRGNPAANMRVALSPLDSPYLVSTTVSDSYGNRRIFEAAEPKGTHVQLSDADGRVRFRVRPGLWLLRLPGDGGSIALDAGSNHSIDVDLGNVATRAKGQVVDSEGRGVAAAIWASSGIDDPALHRLADAPDGKFELCVLRGTTLQARTADGCSEALTLTTDAQDLRFELNRGASVHGVLRDVGGKGLADAYVEVTDGRQRVGVRTDAGGRFTLPGIATGDWRIRARASGSDVTERALRIPADAERSVELVVRSGASLLGRVVDAQGMPVAHTRVCAGWRSSDLEYTATSTDEQGNYRLDGVPCAPVRVTAGLDAEGFACASFHPVSGEVLQWNPVLDPGEMTLRGQLDSSRRPEDLVVAIDASDHFLPIFGQLDGTRFSFVIPGYLRDRSFTLRVYEAESLRARGLRRSLPLAAFEGLRPGRQDLVLAMKGDLGLSSSLHARVDTRGLPAGASLRLLHRDLHHWIEVGTCSASADTVTIDVDHLPAGRYSLAAPSSQARVSFELAGGQDLDLGCVTLSGDKTARPGEVLMTLLFEHPNDDTPMGRMDCRITDAAGRVVAECGVPGDRGTWRVCAALPASRLHVRASTTDGLVHESDFEVRAEDRGVLRFRLEHAR
ncbi:MAG: sigma-70 family RNA polymerase sigma factor [Planctomycetota bacterium]